MVLHLLPPLVTTTNQPTGLSIELLSPSLCHHLEHQGHKFEPSATISNIKATSLSPPPPALRKTANNVKIYTSSSFLWTAAAAGPVIRGPRAVLSPLKRVAS